MKWGLGSEYAWFLFGYIERRAWFLFGYIERRNFLA